MMFKLIAALIILSFSYAPLAVEIPSANLSTDLPVRFILSFDDGPNIDSSQSTASIIQKLKENTLVPGIKALFLVQTSSPDHGGSEEGERLMQQECADGHILALHSGSPRGHINHTNLDDRELDDSLENGKRVIVSICGQEPGLVRPPNWAFDERTLGFYKNANLNILLTDINNNDGMPAHFKEVVNFTNPFREYFLNHQLLAVNNMRIAKKIPSADGVLPVIVTFHDVNPHTADQIINYLKILVNQSKKIGIPLAEPAFYTNTSALLHAARIRAEGPGFVCDGASRSSTLRSRLLGITSEETKGCLK